MQDPVLVGYSYGGGVVMEANRLAPQKASTIALLGSTGGNVGEAPSSLIQQIILSPTIMRWALSVEEIAQLAAGGLMNDMQYPEKLSSADSDALLATLALPNVPSNWARERQEWYTDFEVYQPEQVQACTLIVHGRHDQIVTALVAEENHRHIPYSTLHWLGASGHALVITQAVAITGLIQDHVNTCTDRSGVIGAEKTSVEKI